jgi:AbrB family looped-hinge helix DNA binding protein
MRTTAYFRGVVRTAIFKGDAELKAGPQATTGLGGLQSPYRQVRHKELHAMSTATVISKGQITIRAEVRQALQVKAGDRVEFVQVEPGRFEVVAATRPVTDLRGLFGRPSKAVSIDDMNKAIAARGASAR